MSVCAVGLTTVVMLQVVALMVCSLIHFCFLRFVEPLCERGELAVALLAEVCDAGVFVCGLILILGQSASDRFRYATILNASILLQRRVCSLMCRPGAAKLLHKLVNQ